MPVARARSVNTCRTACTRCSCQNECKTMWNTETVYHSRMRLMNSRSGSWVGVSRVMASSMPTKKVMMRTRTLTSQPSQERSSNVISAAITFLGAARAPLCVLAGQLGDHGEQRHVERNDNAAHAHAQNADDDGLQHGQHVLGGRVHFVLIEVGDFLQHGIHGAGGLAHADHLRNHVGENAALLQG